MSESWPRKCAVVGVGTMGAGFAQLLSLAGVPCAVADQSVEVAEEGRSRAIARVAEYETRGLVPAGAARSASALILPGQDIGTAVRDADLVLEAVAEDPVVKRDVLTAIETSVPPEAVIATNTSAIPIRELAGALDRPQRFLGAHWFNPPQWVPCVEVVPGPDTDPAVVEAIHGFLLRLGKQPVTVGDRAGFVANRLQFAMFREAVTLVDEGVATPQEVDAVVKGSFGFRLPLSGPFLIADMNGLDVYAGAYEALENEHGPRFAVPESVRQRVRAGKPGFKNGDGFYPAPEEGLDDLTLRRDDAYAALTRFLDGLSPLEGSGASGVDD